MWAVLLTVCDGRAGHLGYSLAEVARFRSRYHGIAVCFRWFAVVSGVAAVHVDEVFALGSGRIEGWCILVVATVAPVEER